MSRPIKPARTMPLHNKTGPVRQTGAALIAAIFVITALAALGGLMTQLLVLGSEETIDDWYSAQALYAAESGVEWSVYNGGASSTGQMVVANRAWFDVSVASIPYAGGKTLYTITSTGKAGGTSGSPRTQRQIVVQYMPD
ncbi:MAG: hypothetical protein RRB22_04830 [Gammaproteobacteria bacterium]|nr:hypothetical protein [Gammaproteobacteria bacterium]